MLNFCQIVLIILPTFVATEVGYLSVFCPAVVAKSVFSFMGGDDFRKGPAHPLLRAPAFASRTAWQLHEEPIHRTVVPAARCSPRDKWHAKTVTCCQAREQALLRSILRTYAFRLHNLSTERRYTPITRKGVRTFGEFAFGRLWQSADDRSSRRIEPAWTAPGRSSRPVQGGTTAGSVASNFPST